MPTSSLSFRVEFNRSYRFPADGSKIGRKWRRKVMAIKSQNGHMLIFEIVFNYHQDIIEIIIESIK